MKPITLYLTSLLAGLLGVAQRLGNGFAVVGPRPLPAYVRCRPRAGVHPVQLR